VTENVICILLYAALTAVSFVQLEVFAMKTRIFGVLSLLIAILLTAGIAAAQDQDHAQMNLTGVGGSGITGVVNLSAMPTGSGTSINVIAFGLTPGQEYVSLYYDNHTCALEPYSAEDVIGGMYTANSSGVGTTQGTADDDLDEINSVSVRRAGDF